MDKVPFTEHLGELRKRIVISLSIIIIVFGLCFYYSEYIFHILTLPLHSTIKFSLGSPFISFVPTKGVGLTLKFFAPAEALWMHFKISLISALVISSPVIFYEFWKFVAPGLLVKEKKYALPFVIITTFLFLIGALFCFIIVLPFAMNFLLTYKTENIEPVLGVGKYIDFCLKFIIAFGAIFELPVVVVFLTKTGVVTTEFFSKNRKYAVLLAFVIAALLTPTPDAFNQILMAVPIIVLYEVGIWASKILNVKQKGKEDDK
jgi:sec-independent protein translocase protein TatC